MATWSDRWRQRGRGEKELAGKIDGRRFFRKLVKSCFGGDMLTWDLTCGESFGDGRGYRKATLEKRRRMDKVGGVGKGGAQIYNWRGGGRGKAARRRLGHEARDRRLGTGQLPGIGHGPECFRASKRRLWRGRPSLLPGEVQLPGDRLRRCALIESINERQWA